jgi:phosphoribosylaminoimidazolecarboxamide formyltransferase/IMP cyclohydrolase
MSSIASHKRNYYNGLRGKTLLKLESGENPYQVPAHLFVSAHQEQDRLSLHKLHSQNTNIACFTNLADIDCILHTLCLVSGAFRLRYRKIPYIAIAAKHGNPCGMSVDWSHPEESILGALFGNPLAIWGGEVMVNFKINRDLAKILYKSEKRKRMLRSPYWMLDVIIATDFDREAIKFLSKGSSRKLLKNPALSNPKLPKFKWRYRQVRGGFLRQPYPDYILDMRKAEGNLRFKKSIIDDLIIAWSVVYSSFHGGNEIALVKNNQLIGVGGGPSTVEAAEVAVLRAKRRDYNTKNSVFAADAFFPFTDAPQILKQAGCCAGIVPSGGKNERVVREYFESNNIKMIYIPSKYRGFYRH